MSKSNLNAKQTSFPYFLCDMVYDKKTWNETSLVSSKNVDNDMASFWVNLWCFVFPEKTWLIYSRTYPARAYIYSDILVFALYKNYTPSRSIFGSVQFVYSRSYWIFKRKKPIYFGFLSEKEIVLKLKHKMVFLNNVEITKGNLEFVTMYIWAQGNKTHSFLSVKNWSFSTRWTFA